ncbi:hypothetical protein ABZ799_01355 [Nocardiopsis dassonvillei]|uniref:hypothetical protein n=1 Tax=Nocardiopsis dassonvillei TaxID=2014 RepID=UPI0033D1F6C2
MSDTEAGSAPETGAEATDTTMPEEQGGGFDATPWQSLAEETGLSPEQIKRRLEHSRTWEQRAKENKQAATQAQTLEQQVSELREAMAQRDLADIDRNSRLAVTQVKALLAEKGVRADDVVPLLEHIDATRLLADGDVDDKAVKKLAESLARAAGRPAPDPDQGRRDGAPPADMNSMLRQMAGRR